MMSYYFFKAAKVKKRSDTGRLFFCRIGMDVATKTIQLLLLNQSN